MDCKLNSNQTYKSLRTEMFFFLFAEVVLILHFFVIGINLLEGLGRKQVTA